uniref:Probable prefoldin subunit 6 n=1 Tax=Ascaris suum TaxID=6253 RepID=F1KY87_ASCSU
MTKVAKLRKTPIYKKKVKHITFVRCICRTLTIRSIRYLRPVCDSKTNWHTQKNSVKIQHNRKKPGIAQNTKFNRERNMVNRQQLEGQLTENNLVKTELDLLDDDATVYKLIGPVLVKQDLTEARQNVDKRIDYINTEIKRLEETMADAVKKQEEQKELLIKMQNSMKEMMSSTHK